MSPPSAIPRPRAFAATLALAFALLFVIFYGGASLIGSWIPWRIAPALPLENRIPFLPGWAGVYLSLPLLLLCALLRQPWQRQWALFATLVVQLVIASLCFVLLPVQTTFPPRDSHGLLALADALNLSGNYLPSLHTAFACTAAFVLRRAWYWLWAALILASTLFIHEHHLLDLAAGILLALLTCRHVMPRALAPAALQRVTREWLWLANQYAFARRHRRYAWISVLIYGQRLCNPARGRLLVSGYVFLQAFDDWMDGDRPAPNPPAIADALLSAWPQGRFTDDAEWMRLAAHFRHELQGTRHPAQACQEVQALLATMRDDYLRARTRAVWTEAQILAQHRRTFSHSLNLLLIALDSPLRARDIPELVDALGWCSTLRDLREDLRAGIINIPLSLWQTLDSDTQHDPERLIRHPLLQAWMENGRRHTLRQLAQLDERLPALAADRAGKRIVRIFAGSVRQFARKRYFALYPHLNNST